MDEWPDGIFSAKLISKLHEQNAIDAALPFEKDQVQPASLDLRLGGTAFRVRSSFLPGDKTTVSARIDELKLHQIDLTAGAVLERGDRKSVV